MLSPSPNAPCTLPTLGACNSTERAGETKLLLQKAAPGWGGSQQDPTRGRGLSHQPRGASGGTARGHVAAHGAVPGGFQSTQQKEEKVVGQLPAPQHTARSSSICPAHGNGTGDSRREVRDVSSSSKKTENSSSATARCSFPVLAAALCSATHFLEGAEAQPRLQQPPGAAASFPPSARPAPYINLISRALLSARQMAPLILDLFSWKLI